MRLRYSDTLERGGAVRVLNIERCRAVSPCVAVCVAVWRWSAHQVVIPSGARSSRRDGSPGWVRVRVGVRVRVRVTVARDTPWLTSSSITFAVTADCAPCTWRGTCGNLNSMRARLQPPDACVGFPCGAAQGRTRDRVRARARARARVRLRLRVSTLRADATLPTSRAVACASRPAQACTWGRVGLGVGLSLGGGLPGAGGEG